MSPSPETAMVAIRGQIWENGAHQAVGQMCMRVNLMNDELQVIDLQLGEGKVAVKGALITTQYRGWLEDGTEFDSSYSRGKAFQCVIGTGRVIKGWDQIL